MSHKFKLEICADSQEELKEKLANLAIALGFGGFSTAEDKVPVVEKKSEETPTTAVSPNSSVPAPA